MLKISVRVMYVVFLVMGLIAASQRPEPSTSATVAQMQEK